MQSLGVRELRQNLSVYLRQVSAGEAFAVTDRGRRVALLVPHPDAAHPLADLIAAGKVLPARRRGLDDLPAPVRTDDPHAGSKALAAERAERLP